MALFLLLVLALLNAHAQGHFFVGLTEEQEDVISLLSTVPGSAPMVTLPSVSVADVEAADAQSHSTPAPYRFAVPVSTSLSTADGAWKTVGSRRVWRLALTTAQSDVGSMNLRFEDVQLPTNGYLAVVSEDGTQAVGPFRSSDVLVSQDNLLSTLPVYATSVVIAVVIPAQQSRSSVKLSLVQVNLGYQGPGLPPSLEKNHRTSGLLAGAGVAHHPRPRRGELRDQRAVCLHRHADQQRHAGRPTLLPDGQPLCGVVCQRVADL
jgi:hypothetical protein